MTGYASIDKPWEKKKIFVPKKIKVPNITWIELLFRRSKVNACKELLRCHEASTTDKEFKQEVERYAKAFKQYGVKKGDYICLCMQEVIETAIVEGALNLIGAVSVNLPANCSSLGMAKYLELFTCNLFVVSDCFFERVCEATKDRKDVKNIIIPTDFSFKKISNLSQETVSFLEQSRCDFVEDCKNISLTTFLEQGEQYTDNIYGQSDIEAPAKVLFTSGSTGEPKPILLSNRNIVVELLRLKNQTHMQLGPKGICLKVVADMYPYGNIVSKYFPMYVGKTVGLTPILNNQNAFYYMNLYKPVFVQGIPSFFFSLEKDERFKMYGLFYLKYAVSGGEKYETTAKERSNAFLKSVGSKAVILDGAGAGEVVACATTAVGSRYNINSVGKPMVGINVKVIDETTKEELKYNEDGIICFSGETVMLEYYKDIEATQRSMFFDSENVRWFMTDGIGHVDEKGYLYIVGRKARCFITYDSRGSAYKVYPERIEEVLKQNMEIEECAVVYITSKERDKEPKAYIRLRADVEFNKSMKEKIINSCKNSDLPECCVPYEIECWSGEFPRINDTKVDYKKIQEMAVEGENFASA